MTTQRRKREKRKVSAARRRAEQHASGYETTVLRVPDGVGFWSMSPGTRRVAIVPYIAGKGNPFAEPGELYYERTFWVYRRIGPEERDYVAPGKTFGKPDPIQEWRQKEARRRDADVSFLKSLEPKERQIFLIYDLDEPQKGIQLLEVSYHVFGRLLDTRIKNSTEEDGWDLFYYPDEDGSTLRLTIEEVRQGGYTFNRVSAIDFIPRKSPLPKEIVNHGICLDDLLVETPYDKLKQIFLGMLPEENQEGPEGINDEDEEVIEKEPEPEPDVDEDDEVFEDEEPEPEEAKPSVSFGKGDSVKYKGQVWEVFRVSKDGLLLTLVCDDEVLSKVPATEVSPIVDDDDLPDDEEVSSDDVGDDEWDEDWDE